MVEEDKPIEEKTEKGEDPTVDYTGPYKSYK